jgi:hypothetical protein
MSNEVLINDNASVAYLPGFSAVVTTEKKVKAHTSPVQKVTGSTEIAPWGDDNLFPQNVTTLAEKTFIPTVINWQVRALGTKLVYGIEEIDEATGKAKFKRKKDPVVEAFLRRTNIQRYIIEGASDLYWFANVFPEMILSNDRNEIVSLAAQEATNCRFTKQNPNTGLVEEVCVNANWDNGGNYENSHKIPVIDPYYDPVTALRERKEFKYIYPVSFPSPGKTYYQLVSWDSVRKNGWLELASLIPTWKKALMKNQIIIKYHIEVPEYYWSWKYPNWEKMTVVEKTSARTTELENFNSFLKGEENAGRSIMTTSKFDDIRNVAYPGWKITAIDDKIQDGKYIEDSQEASSHLMFAIGLDSTLIAAAPGKGMGAGSGSDKRVAFNIYMQLQQANEHLLLEPLHFIRDYNGWNSEYIFKLERSVITTLDAGTETKPTA